MEPKKQWNVDWVKGEENLPEEGSPCPKCSSGDLAKSKWGGMWCPNCKYKWKVSQFNDGDGPKEPKWSPKILDAEEKVKLHNALADINLKLDFIISKIKEKEGAE